jgi:hypothetical protein
MIDLGPATENDMVLAFLRAEVDSARFGALYQSCFDQLGKFGFDRQALVDSPNLQSAEQNAIRKAILKAVRGYTAGQLLFTGFPVDVTWRRISMEHADLSKLKYANCPPWIELSKDTRFVVEGARNVGADTPAEDAAVNIRAVADDLKRGRRYPELIGVDGQNGDIILMEGHTRATAYALTQLPERIECIVGSSPTMRTWTFY